jgi:hypothetical protein
VTVEVIDPRGKVIPGLAPRFDSSDPDTAKVEFYPEGSGKYEIAATLRSGGKVLANAASDVQVQGRDRELAEPDPRPDNLRAIAAATGGTYLDIEAAADLAGQIERVERRRAQQKRSEYWDSPWLFAAFLCAVSGEWFLRRRNHMV